MSAYEGPAGSVEVYEGSEVGGPAVVADACRAVRLHNLASDETVIVIRAKGANLSAYALGDTDAMRIYGILSLLQKQGLVWNP